MFQELLESSGSGGGGMTQKWITLATWNANSYFTVTGCPFKPKGFLIFSGGIGYGGNIEISTEDFTIRNNYKQSNGTEYPCTLNNDGFTVSGAQSSSSSYTYYVMCLA